MTHYKDKCGREQEELLEVLRKQFYENLEQQKRIDQVDSDQVVVNSRLSSLQGGMSFLMNGSPVKGEKGQSLRVSPLKNSMRTNTMM